MRASARWWGQHAPLPRPGGCPRHLEKGRGRDFPLPGGCPRHLEKGRGRDFPLGHSPLDRISRPGGCPRHPGKPMGSRVPQRDKAESGKAQEDIVGGGGPASARRRSFVVVWPPPERRAPTAAVPPETTRPARPPVACSIHALRFESLVGRAALCLGGGMRGGVPLDALRSCPP